LADLLITESLRDFINKCLLHSVHLNHFSKNAMSFSKEIFEFVSLTSFSVMLTGSEPAGPNDKELVK